MRFVPGSIYILPEDKFVLLVLPNDGFVWIDKGKYDETIKNIKNLESDLYQFVTDIFRYEI